MFSTMRSSLLCLLMAIAVSEAAMTKDQQRQHLLRFYDLTDGTRWIQQSGWNDTSSDICTWFGIECEGDNVKSINLEDNNLVGRVAKVIYELPELRELDLKDNKLRDGGFGAWADLGDSKLMTLNLAGNSLANLAGLDKAPASLKFLHLSDNALTGPFPDVITQLTNLKELFLSFNSFSGTLPKGIGKLSNLEKFYLYGNELEGTIPREIGNLNKVKVFTMAENKFSGTLPRAVKDMVNLEIFSLHSNDQGSVGLTGPLRDFGKAVRLKELRLEGNNFDGTIPASILLFSNVTDELVTINLANNQLTGSVPLSLNKFESLNLDITGNRLDVPLSDKFCNQKAWMAGAVEQFGCDAIACPAGTYMKGVGKVDGDPGVCDDCPSNKFLGATTCNDSGDSSEPLLFEEWMILATFYRETNGPELWNNTEGWNQLDDMIHNTSFASGSVKVGPCDNWYGVTCENDLITGIDLKNNNLVGTVPPIIFALQALTTLDLSHNAIDLSKDAKLSASNTLQSLSLTATKVSSLRVLKGAPDTMTNLYLDNMKDLDYIGFPGEILKLKNLRTLHMQHTNLEGTLPKELGDLMKMKRLKLFGNGFTGSLPTQLGLMVELEELELSENLFTGTLNSEMVNQWKLIKSIHLHNSVQNFMADMKGFTGSIPAFNELPLLEELSMDFHSFSGSIPTTFLKGIKNKNKEIGVHLSYNQLTGTIPKDLKTFTMMTLDLEGNKISKIDSELCKMSGWMKGKVGDLLNKVDDDSTINPCDAILCSKRTFNIAGKAGVDTPCMPCNESKDDFLGHTWCGALINESTDKLVLDLLYKKTGGRYWKKHEGWNEPDVEYCKWQGVECDANKNVIGLNLMGFGLQGTVPDSIFDLSALKMLSLTNNDKVDISFKQLNLAKNLITLKLSNTHLRSLTGLEKGTETKVTELHLAGNQLVGSFPTELTKLTGLKQVFLNNNLFSGSLPPAISDMSSLESLYLAGNKLTGPIPEEIGKLTQLINLDLELNSLSGNLPTSMNSLIKLTSLLLKDQQGDHKLGGPLLPFDQVYGLGELDLSHNEFSGIIPETFLDDLDGNKTIKVDLSFNKITGKIPASLSKINSLFLNLAENEITAIDPSLCTADSGWMNGDVAEVDGDRCNAILCPAGTALPEGRQTDPNTPCEQCPLFLAEAPFFGATKCNSHVASAEITLLEEFFDQTNGTSWVRQRNWKSDRSICTWFGIKCNANGAVKEIDLSGNGLTAAGDVSKLLWDLRFLEVLNLKSNDIPLTFSGINADDSSLKELHLSATGLKSVEGLSVLSDQLDTLHITDNDINGNFPSDLLKMTKLERLYMSFNDFGGPLPDNFGTLSNLKEFYAYGNSFTGSLPSNTELVRLSNLVEFIIPNNYLEGTIPSQFSSMPVLEQLSLYEQQSEGKLSGALPDFVNSPNLWYIDVTSNFISGTIPESFMKNSNYFSSTDFSVSVDLGNNELKGSIPNGLAKFSSLALDITGNGITKISPKFCNLDGWMEGVVGDLKDDPGSNPCDAIACAPGTYAPNGKQENTDDKCEVCQASKDKAIFGMKTCMTSQSEKEILKELYLLTGGEEWENDDNWNSDEPLCSWYGITCASENDSDNEGVSEINLEDNNLTGAIPSWIWSLPFLRSLNVKENDVAIDFLGLDQAANTLEVLYLSETNLDTLYGISQASSLRELHITNCGLSGPLPGELFDMGETLESLYIAYNAFTGTIPAKISQLTKLQNFYAYDNDFQGQLPTELGHLIMLKNLILSENLIEGQLPDSLSELNNLELLSIYRRSKPGPKLTGVLPALDKNPMLKKLYLDNNKISGPIPENFLSSTVNGDKEILLSYNMLTGTVPESLGDIKLLDLELEGNRLTDFPSSFCDNKDWMGGLVATSCNAFLCPRNTFAPDGRFTETTSNSTGSDCTECEFNAMLVGRTTCENEVDQRNILTNLYSSMGGAEWFDNTNWAKDNDVCSWYGIECNDVKQVVRILLSNNNLVGSPQSELFNLPKLETLDLSFNPTDIPQLQNLEKATSLTTLRLDATRLKSLNGLHDAPSLMFLDIRFNALEGEFPVSFSKLTNLRDLNMAYNNLNGMLPQSNVLDQLKYLKTLRLDHNQFTGTLPTFENNYALTEVDLSANQISGVIPDDFFTGATITNNYRIDLANNKLRGAVPVALAKLDFVQLYLRDNQITSLPKEFCNRYGWFDGSVRLYGCDAIMCPPGTFSFSSGRFKQDQPCQECLDKSSFYGQSNCLRPGKSYSGTTDTRSGMMGMIVSVISLLCWLVL